MSLPSVSALPTTALPAVNAHSRGHGHNKGVDLDTDSGSTQNLFGSLLSSLEQVIGVKPAASASTQKASTAATLGQTATSVLSTVGSALKFLA